MTGAIKTVNVTRVCTMTLIEETTTEPNGLGGYFARTRYFIIFVNGAKTHQADRPFSDVVEALKQFKTYCDLFGIISNAPTGRDGSSDIIAAIESPDLTPEHPNDHWKTWTDTNHPFSKAEVRELFKSPYSVESRENKRQFKLLGLLDPTTYDAAETGPYYRIQFLDGKQEEMVADPIEIFRDIGTVGGVPW